SFPRDQQSHQSGVHHQGSTPTAEVLALAAFLGDARGYPLLKGLQPDLYRCFMEQTWRNGSSLGTVSLIHPETHFTDEKAGALRQATYERLRRHWHFVNELKLFEEPDHHVTFGVQVYGSPREPHFLNAASLYHPDTAIRSLAHDGSGPEPGLKDSDGEWDLRPHLNRILNVTEEVLDIWNNMVESIDSPIRQTRMVYTVNQSVERVLEKLSAASRIGELGFLFSGGWHEKSDRAKGYFEISWGVPEVWDDVILQGPHLNVATPLYKSPNPTMRSQNDWSESDFETLCEDAIPATSYKPVGPRKRYDADYSHWDLTDEGGAPMTVHARDYFRIAWRNMTKATNARAFFPAIIPPGAAHIHGVTSATLPRESLPLLVVVSGVAASLITDLSIRTVPKSTISAATFNRLPWIGDDRVWRAIAIRTLRLNCVTNTYADLWRECFDQAMQADDWAGGFDHNRRRPLGGVGLEWTGDTPLRIAADRRQALVEIDALVALAMRLSADELCTVYRSQFPVLYGYDHGKSRKTQEWFVYDANGRRVPGEVLRVWRTKGDDMTVEERTATNEAGNTYTYEPPFQFLDREADMRAAYAEFEKRLLADGSS
ncbi:class I SAM-dependent DNA methyltransferase, partial [Mycolicibacterium thermoresistibile]